MEEMVKKRNQRVLLLMAEILHQLRLVVYYPTIYRGLYIPGGAGFQPSTVPNCPFLGKQNSGNFAILA